MKELKGHIYHKKRKWRCPKCERVKMQTPKWRFCPVSQTWFRRPTIVLAAMFAKALAASV